MITLDVYYCKHSRTPAELDADFIAFCKRCSAVYPGKVHTVYCDSAEQVLINGFRAAAIRERIPLDIRNAKKGPIVDRIRFLCRMMASGRYLINQDCKNTIEALQTSCWDSKHITQDVRLDDGTNNQDSIDALEYSFEPYIQSMTYIGGCAKT